MTNYMIDQALEVKKLARIEKDLISPVQENEENADIIIKIRNGVIVWAETSTIEKIRVDFKEVFEV